MFPLSLQNTASCFYSLMVCSVFFNALVLHIISQAL